MFGRRLSTDRNRIPSVNSVKLGPARLVDDERVKARPAVISVGGNDRKERRRKERIRSKVSRRGLG